MVERETSLLSAKIEKLHDIDKQYTATTKQRQRTDLQQIRLRRAHLKDRLHHKDRVRQLLDRKKHLAKDRTRLHNEIKLYPQATSVRSRVIQKLANDLWDTTEVTEEEHKKNRDKLVEYARWGGKYSQLRPAGIIFFLGDTPTTV
jgi:hypothetical protein